MSFGFGRFGGRRRLAGWEVLLRRAVDKLPDADRVVDFVLTGDSAQALSGIRGRGLCPDADSWSFNAGFADRDPAVLRRWGTLLEAVSQNYPGLFGWGDIGGHRWPELLLARLQHALPADADPPFTLAHLAAAVAMDGADVADMLSAAVAAPRWVANSGGPKARQMLVRLPGYADALVAHADLVSRSIADGSADQRLPALELVTALPDEALAPFAPAVARAATASGVRLRETAQHMVGRFGLAGLTALRSRAVKGSPEERGRALELLRSQFNDRDFAEETAATDRAASVRALSATWRAAVEARDEARDESLMEVAAPSIVWGVSAEDADRIVDGVMSELSRLAADEQRLTSAGYSRRTSVRVDAGVAERLRAELVSSSPPSVAGQPPDIRVWWAVLKQLVVLARGGHLTAPAMWSTLSAFGLAKEHIQPSLYGIAEVLEAVHAATGGPDLLSLQAMFDECGLAGAELVWFGYTRTARGFGRRWPREQVWPFVARNLDFLLQRGRAPQSDYAFDEGALVAALSTFPTKPLRVLEVLYERALGSRKNERRPAQNALADDPQRTDRVVAGLADGKADTRTVAAQWLTRIADPAAQPALEKAFAKEKQDGAKAAILDALQALGRPVEHYLDATTLRSDAEKAAVKGLPRELEWLSWDTLPAVHWSASGEPVPGVVLQYLVAQAVRAKSSEPNAILRKYAGLMVESEREELARVLIELWLAEDTRPRPRADAEGEALQQAQASYRYLTHPGSAYAGMTVEQVAATLLPAYLRQPAGSATGSKGLLAVVAAMGGAELVPPAERFMREWYGMRAAQCKALVAMLAWVEHPAATQLVLAVGNRFRTRGIQEEASRQVQALAERRGWTLAELADRTVPTVGFEEEGRRTFEYGADRSFTALLLPDLTIELRDATGAVLKTLPPPRKSDDADAVAAAKKAFVAAKKELKAVGSLQMDRLHEALHIGRSWTAADWLSYLAGHPIVRLLVARLVWVATIDDVVVASFRLLDDGTLTDVDDESVEPDPGWQIRLAHDSNLPVADAERWLAHLADYEVQPLFTQLGRGLLTVAEAQRYDERLADIEGHLLRSFALRGRAGKLGWTRGPAEDGGWFYSYTKRFATSGVTAVLTFTGSPLPEEDRSVALRSLGFEQDVGDGHRRPLPLGEVPAVLLSETWHEVRELAAMGTGFDPDWEKETEF